MSTQGLTAICRLDQIDPESGVTALVDGVAVAIFRTHDGNLYAISNHDPVSQASVMSRGIVGSRGDIPCVMSPMHKQAYDLRTGECLDQEGLQLDTYRVQVVDGLVVIG